MTTLRVGLIGYGAMGRNHARVLGELDFVDLVGVVDPNNGGGLSPSFDSIGELLRVGVDYCVVAVPTSLHEDVALRLAHEKIHAFIEKPLAHTLESAKRIASAYEDPTLIGAVGHVERFNPALAQARTRIANGDLGDVLQVTTRRQGPFPSRISDVGVVRDLGTHDFDLTSWLMESRYQVVAAQVGHRSGREHEDLVSVSARLENGTLVNHVINWLSPVKQREITILGERGAFVVDTLSADLTYFENGQIPTQWEGIARFRGVTEGKVTRFAFPKPEPLRVEHEAFRNCILGISSEIVTLEDGLKSMAVAEAVLQSSETSQTVLVERPT